MMDWTRDAPTEYGYYWIRPNMKVDPEMCSITVSLEFWDVKAVRFFRDQKDYRIDQVAWLWWPERILSPDEIPVESVDVLGIPTAAKNALKRAGITTVYAASKANEIYMSRIDGISKATVSKIKEAIRAHKLGIGSNVQNEVSFVE
jgi:hypothetical protein